MSIQSIPALLQVDFETLNSARDAIRAYVVNMGESYIVSHSDRTHYIVACRDTFCKFGIRAAVLKGPKVHITRYKPHTCSPITHINFRQANLASFLVDWHREMVVDNREILPAQIQSIERIHHGNAGVSYQQAWCTREALRMELEGDEAKCFRKLPAMLSTIDNYNDGNHAAIETQDGRFYRGLVIPGALRAAYEACCPFIALDGCHTKSRFRMTLLIACTLDGNNEILPLAWAVVPIEDKDNWIWFLSHMKEWVYGMDAECHDLAQH